MAEPRMTIELHGSEDEGREVQLYLNEPALETLIRELTALSRQSDHTHFLAPDWGEENNVVSLVPYNSGTDTAGHLKVMFRPDDWDREHYPHVMGKPVSQEEN